jgi:hypothetical protein
MKYVNITRQAQLSAACLCSGKECRPALGIYFDKGFKPAFQSDRGRVQDDTSYRQDAEKRACDLQSTSTF